MVLASAPGPSAVEARQIGGTISNDDYPADAIRAGEQGHATAEFIVDVSGRVTNCRITATSGSAALDRTTCEIIKQRFQFEPARNSSGGAIATTMTRNVRWVLPDDEPGSAPFEAPPVAFVAGAIRITLGGVVQERPRCAVEMFGSTFESHRTLQCYGMEQVDIAQLGAAPVRMITTVRLLPAGQRLPTIPDVAGATLVASSAATIEVDADGRLRQCTPVVTANDIGQGSVCDVFPQGSPLFAPDSGVATRRAAYTVEVHRAGVQPAPAT